MTTVNKILEEAKKYIGVSGGSDTHKWIIDTYNSVKPLPVGYHVKYTDDWCDAFLTFLAIRTNATELIGRECGVERHIAIFKNLGIWNEEGIDTPIPGDIITFNWDTSRQPNDGFADHIGIVESVENGIIKTIEGNSNNMVRRCQYAIGNSKIRGYARPKYLNSEYSEYNEGGLVNAGKHISQSNIQSVIKYSKLYNIKPSFMIAQMFVESHWGHAGIGEIDNNWSGISEPFYVPSHLGIKMRRGSLRPSNEGGYYIHFETMDDYFKAYAYLLSTQKGIYQVENVSTIESFCKGLFKVGGAKYDYAASGYAHYYKLLIPTYSAIQRQNPGKLEKIDNSTINFSINSNTNASQTNTFNLVSESGTFYPNQTVNIRNHPSRNAQVIDTYTSGESFNYDSYVVNDGHIWLSYISSSGTRRYVAWRVQNGEKFGVIH